MLISLNFCLYRDFSLNERRSHWLVLKAFSASSVELLGSEIQYLIQQFANSAMFRP